MRQATKRITVPKRKEVRYAGHTVVVECMSRHDQMFDTEFVYNVREGDRILGTMTTYLNAKGVTIRPTQWHESLRVVHEADKVEAVKRLIDWLPIQSLISDCIEAGCPKLALGWFINYKANEKGIKLPKEVRDASQD